MGSNLFFVARGLPPANPERGAGRWGLIKYQQRKIKIQSPTPTNPAGQQDTRRGGGNPLPRTPSPICAIRSKSAVTGGVAWGGGVKRVKIAVFCTLGRQESKKARKVSSCLRRSGLRFFAAKRHYGTVVLGERTLPIYCFPLPYVEALKIPIKGQDRAGVSLWLGLDYWLATKPKH